MENKKGILGAKVKVSTLLYDVLLTAVGENDPREILKLFCHACMTNSVFLLDSKATDAGLIVRYVLDNWDEILPKAEAHWKEHIEQKGKKHIK